MKSLSILKVDIYFNLLNEEFDNAQSSLASNICMEKRIHFSSFVTKLLLFPTLHMIFLVFCSIPKNGVVCLVKCITIYINVVQSKSQK